MGLDANCGAVVRVAALYVQKGGAYFGMPDVDPWDEARDARLYDGPHPVVAHPPCARWCRLAGFVEKTYGYKRGEDGGCFAAALASLRARGGVLEHPAHSKAWEHFGLPKPPRSGGWVEGAGGWSCHVEQRQYGHRANKPTWLFAVGCDLPELRWGQVPGRPEAVVGSCSNNGDGSYLRGSGRMTQREASATPPEFKAVLLAMARSVYGQRRAA